jgi:PKD repeat protein
LSKQGKNIDIDDLFRMKLEDYPVEPGAGVKSNLMKRVARREFFRFNPARMNVWYASAAATVVTIALAIALSDNRSHDAISKTAGQTDIVTLSSDLPSEAIADTITSSGREGIITEERGRKPGTVSGVTKDEQTASDLKREVTSVKTDDSKTSVKSGTTDITISVRDDRNAAELALVSSFTASQLTGCAPLTITLNNTSPIYKSLKWRSSDGKSSTLPSPEWTFALAGKYTVILTVTDEGGRQGHSSLEITVLPVPIARFDIVPVKRESSEREVMLYNYSEGFQSARWDFGDGTQSSQRETEHRYEKAGNYRILLTVTNGEGCTDTVSKLFKARTDAYRIDFPNAFIPNPNGPTGGYYSPLSDAAAQVFHPEYEGIAEYHLIIYTRTGIVIFESRDINVGWDGYYRGQLGEPGVYVWRSTGRYSNGEFFRKSGDVTLLKIR